MGAGRTFWALASATLLAPSVLLLGVGPAGAATSRPPIRPNQQFVGLVNRSSGVASPVTVLVDCPGPLRPGQTGHPLPGQTLEVVRPEVIVGSVGNTGPHGATVRVLFGPPPPAGMPTAAAAGLVFGHYSVPRPIPGSLNLPCSGTSTAVFLPQPFDQPGARPAIVPVTFVSPPA
jgi:hypothetical protein